MGIQRTPGARRLLKAKKYSRRFYKLFTCASDGRQDLELKFLSLFIFPLSLLFSVSQPAWCLARRAVFFRRKDCYVRRSVTPAEVTLAILRREG